MTKASTLSVEYDCGTTVEWPLPLADGESLAHGAWIDWLVKAADAMHNRDCTTCDQAGKGEEAA